jgi:hypothetical protein
MTGLSKERLFLVLADLHQFLRPSRASGDLFGRSGIDFVDRGTQ